MSEKKFEDLPPVYSNLGFDAEYEAGPSAPTSQENFQVGADPEFEAGPSAPTGQENFNFGIDFESEAGPSAPANEEDPRIDADLLPPPPPYEAVPPPGSNFGLPPLVYNPPSLVFEDIYDACAIYVKKHCCYGSRFINQMKLTEITNRAVFHYILMSFGEKRESAIRTSPYKGGDFDGPHNGPAPNPWDMSASPPHMFVDCSITTEIPHTTTIHTCSKCDGRGKVRCSSCSGSGRRSCSSCSGRGRKSDGDRCFSCSGSGKTRCLRCSGTGRVTCSKCDGYGKVKKCRILVVTWKNHAVHFVTDTDNLPKERILKAEGNPLFEKQDTALQPLLHAPDDTVNAASISLLETHQRSFPSELIILQRHNLRGIPFTRVKYQWKDKEGEFYVYGKERRVYFEDYPQSCCCCTCS